MIPKYSAVFLTTFMEFWKIGHNFLSAFDTKFLGAEASGLGFRLLTVVSESPIGDSLPKRQLSKATLKGGGFSILTP